MSPFFNARREIVLYRVVIVALALFCANFLWSDITDWVYDNFFPSVGNVIVEPRAPKAREIKKLIAPLKYTGLGQGLGRSKDSRMSISIDFKKHIWALRNVHEFDSNGRIVLRGNSGLCGDLAAYTYDRVRKLLDPARYAIRFLRVAEVSFFKGDKSSHTVLEITDKQAQPEPVVYVLDPAFRRYGSFSTFGTYEPREAYTQPDFVRDRSEDQIFLINTGPPIHIGRRVMLSLYVVPWKGKFDEKNYAILLAGLKRYDYFSKPVLYYVRQEGVTQILEKENDLEEFMIPGHYRQLEERVLALCRNVRYEELVLPSSLPHSQVPANPSAVVDPAVVAVSTP